MEAKNYPHKYVVNASYLPKLVYSFYFPPTALYSFPYVLKRIPVKDRQSFELSPIEVAIDEMQAKTAELEEVVLGPIDLKKLQLRLQGSVAVTVNAGPLAYASAFLDPKHDTKYSTEKVEELKDIFRYLQFKYTFKRAKLILGFGSFSTVTSFAFVTQRCKSTQTSSHRINANTIMR